MTGRTISHYRLAERIGRGASGFVYKADDLTLKRTVAIKVIKPSHQDPRVANERFLREAQAISQIDHPNVVTVFEVLQEGASNYLVMQYVKGSSLREIIERGGIGCENGARHRERYRCRSRGGARHRSGPPRCEAGKCDRRSVGESEDSRFRRGAPRSRSTLTQKGRIVGTIPYMAPEQVKGSAVGPWTDIYALGVVLYEMLAGRRPFVSGEEAALFYQIINVDAEPVGSVVSDLPEGIEAIVAKALEKDPAKRYASAADMRHDLDIVLERLKESSEGARKMFAKPHHRIRTSLLLGAIVLVATAVMLWRTTGHRYPGEKTPPRIMVTRANNSLGSADLEYLSSGMMDGLITALGRMKGFSVVSRQTLASAERTLNFRAAGLSAQGDLFDAAERVGADYLVTASFAKSGGVIRLSCELNDVSKGVLVGSWSHDLTDLEKEFFSTVDQFASGVAAELGAGWKEDRITGRAGKGALTPSLEALKYFEQGVEAWEATDAAGVIDNMRAAIERDPQFTAAYLWLARITPEPDEQKSALESAMKYRHKAPAGLKTMVEAAYYSANDRIDDAIGAYERVLAEDPEEVFARTELAALLVQKRRFDEAVAEYTILKRVTPFDYSFYYDWWVAYFEIRREDKALSILREWRTNVRDEPAPLSNLVILTAVEGRWEESLAYSDTLVQVSPTSGHFRGHLLMQLGRLNEAEAIFERMTSEPDRSFARGRGYTYLADVSYHRGDYAEGLKRIDRAMEDTEDFYNFWIEGRLAAGIKDFTRAEKSAAGIAAYFDAAKDDSTTVEALAYRRFYYDLLGEIALARKDYPRAVRMFESSLRFATRVDSPFFRTYLGRAYLDSGDYQRAAAEFERVLEINRNHPESLFYLGKTRIALGEKEKAKAALDRLAGIWNRAGPDYPPKKELDEMWVLSIAGSQRRGSPPAGGESKMSSFLEERSVQ